MIDYDINQLMTRFTSKAMYGLRQSAKAWVHHVQQLSNYSDYAPNFDSYTKSRLNHLERFWYDKTKLMYYGDPPLLMDTMKDYQWYFDVTNPIVISIKSILTFMTIRIGCSGSKFNSHFECDKQCYKCSGSSKYSGSSGSSGRSGSTGINTDPCSTSDKDEGDIIEIQLSFHPENEYNLAGILEWEEDNEDQVPTLNKNNGEGNHQTNRLTSELDDRELRLLLEDWDEEEDYLEMNSQPPTWIGIN